jgi:type II secretory pathway component PulF
MASYSYQAINSAGKTVSGTIEAGSLAMAEANIADGDMIPVLVKALETRSASLGQRFKRATTAKIKVHELVLFSKQFCSMFRAGIPVLRVLEIIGLQCENSSLKQAVAEIREDIMEGTSLSDAMRKYPAIFSPLYCSMINAGEVSGTVPEVIDRLTYILEHEDRVKASIRSALQYPMVVAITLTIAFFVLLTVVIPKFAAVFKASKLTLPLPTLIAISMYNAIVGYWALMLVGVVSLVVVTRLYLKTENGRFVKDSLLLRLPIFGPLFIKAAMSRFSSILAILFASGVPVMSAIGILSDIIGNSAISRAFGNMKAQLEEGQGLAGPLGKVSYFTPMVINMVAIGEESGNLDGMLKEITIHYDEEVKHAVSRMADLIGPILTVLLAVVVGFFALAIYMPMWDLTKMVRH